ncbi:hypothetical protein ABI214_02770 [Prescottella soli]|uniref:Uncharacterized protein n=1 Tax=Prescottella soli TaxID=1543852 RepID=A0ABW9FVI5_9NOCA
MQHRTSVPEDEIPVILHGGCIPARTDDVALWIDNIHVFSTGIEFTIRARYRSAAQVEVFGLGPDTHPHTNGARLHLAVAYPDGRLATNTVDFRSPPHDPNQPYLSSGSAISGEASAYARHFLSPLPPPGPLTVAFALPEASIGEHRLILDGSAILEAAAGVVRLWPPEQTDTPNLAATLC